MQCSLISGYFHDFTEERTMMLKVFPDDDLGSTAHDRKKVLGNLSREILYPCIPDSNGEDEGGQVSSSLAVSI
ncbi:hypothetical protein GW17_00054154 [Ensete ventricosum]|nr:hypothetical protein GW17_00054154 [Ensete ventricosum]